MEFVSGDNSFGGREYYIRNANGNTQTVLSLAVLARTRLVCGGVLPSELEGCWWILSTLCHYTGNYLETYSHIHCNIT